MINCCHLLVEVLDWGYIEKCIEPSDDSNNEVLNRDNLELAPPSTKLNMPKLAELETAPSSQHFGQVVNHIGQICSALGPIP